MEDLTAEFMALLRSSGWSKAEAARQLDVTPSLISQYAGGVTRPSPQMLRLFKLVLLTENPSALQAAGSSGIKYPEHKNEFGEMNDQLIELKRADPKAFATVKTMLTSVHAQVTAQPRANLVEAVALGDPSELDVAGVPRSPAAPAPRSATAAPIAHRRAPVAPARSRSSAPPATPKPVPVEPAP